MISNENGNARRGRFHFSRLGYTMTEMLIVVLIIGIIAGVSAVSYKNLSPDKAAEREAQKLSRWLTNLETMSNRTGESFKLICPGNISRGYVEAIWQSSSKKNTYTSAYGCKFSRYGGGGVDSLYSPQWSAMVPTITIKVSSGTADHFTIVSQHGRVRTNKQPSL